MLDSEVMVIVLLIAVIVAQLVMGMRERGQLIDTFAAERAGLMNRIIAKDAREFAMLTRATAPVDARNIGDYVSPQSDELKDDGLGMPVT